MAINLVKRDRQQTHRAPEGANGELRVKNTSFRRLGYRSPRQLWVLEAGTVYKIFIRLK